MPAARFNPRWPAPQRRSSPTTGTKNTAPHGGAVFLHERDSNPRALRNVPAARFNPRWPAPQRRSSPTTGTKKAAPHGGAVFLHEWTRTRGRLETCRRHVSTRGGLRRSAGRVPPPAPKKDSVPRGRCLFFVLLPSDRAGHGQNGGAGGDRPKSGSCILRVDRGRNGDAACCRGKDAGCGVIAVVSGLGPRVAV